MTGSTLYEAVEPHALWSRLLSVVLSDITSGQPNGEVRLGCRSPLDIKLTITSKGMWHGPVSPPTIPRS